MKQTINESMFMDAFQSCDRGTQFSYDGMKALFEYLESYEDDTGEQWELDVIALCCEYTEYGCLDEFWQNYDEDNYPDMQTIEDNTPVIDIPNSTGFIIQNF